MNFAQHKEQRVGVFVDVQNMYYSAKNLFEAKVDFGKVLTHAVAGRKLVRAFTYVIKADVGAEQDFFDALSKLGYEVRQKDLQVFIGGSKKGDWDVGLCMDAVRMVSKIDVMVLVSGDGDYVDLLDYAHSQGVRTEVMSFGQTTSRKLIDAADYFVDMEKVNGKFLIGFNRIKKHVGPVVSSLANSIQATAPGPSQGNHTMPYSTPSGTNIISQEEPKK